MVLDSSHVVVVSVATAAEPILSTQDSRITCHCCPAVPYCPYRLASGGRPSGDPTMDDWDCGGTRSPSAPLPAASGWGAGSPSQTGAAWTLPIGTSTKARTSSAMVSCRFSCLPK
ncbi:hypothetical protein CDO52_06850 [Nocardiopsis gilva YIM 90087]|uniref:Uncharacterized protein n=1 Tax=Nocardiopsis gilva YIM 90087 TaxID=1235441 RepID=A0A223SDD7_9ACTN|nr:hypothetical protein CDO52_06850 [Nocardiopsis gilva YIM 90087]